MKEYAPFDGPRLKVQWANRHIIDINRDITIFVESNPYRFGINFDSEKREYSAGVFSNAYEAARLANHVTLRTADVIHNLRAALDIAVCGVAEINGKKIDRKVFFPFAKTSDEFYRLISDTNRCSISVVAPQIVDAVKRLEPYQGGNGGLLYSLHELDKMDKHRFIVPALQSAVAKFEGIKIINAAGGTVNMNNSTIVFDPRQGYRGIIGLGSGKPKLEINQNIETGLEISFGKGQILEGKPIVPTLRSFSKLTIEIIESFASLIRG